MSTGQGQGRERDRSGNEIQQIRDCLRLLADDLVVKKGKRIEQLEDQLQLSEHRQGSVLFFFSLSILSLSTKANSATQ